jgi:hypothetical protein
MYIKSFRAMLTAARLLLKNRRTLALMLIVYVCLLAATYLFVSTREASVFQLVLTLVVVVVAPALFFLLQVLSVSYPSAPASVRKLSTDCLKLIVVSVPVIAVTILGCLRTEQGPESSHHRHHSALPAGRRGRTTTCHSTLDSRER